VKPLLSALGLALLLAAPLVAETPPPGQFESLGIPVRVGGLMGCVVGSNGRGGEALYFNFNQTSGRLFLVQVDPDTGEARQFHAPQGPGAWALIAGPEEKIYLGTWDGGLILRFDPKQPDRGIEVIGKPSSTEEHLWQFDLGQDGKLYACTYPQAKLVSFDPKTGAMADLGRMHPTEMYARSLAVGRTARCMWASAPRKATWSCSIPRRRNIAASFRQGCAARQGGRRSASRGEATGTSMRSSGRT